MDHLLAWPKAYALDAVLVPAIRTLLGAAAPKCAAAIERLRAACLCPRCAELARFLADPERRTWVFKAAEADRRHVEETIKWDGCDVDPATDRRGRPMAAGPVSRLTPG